MKRYRYRVTGMSCAACVAHVEHAAAKVCGKESIQVSLLTNSLTVTVDDRGRSVFRAFPLPPCRGVRLEAIRGRRPRLG